MQPRFDRGYTGHEHMCGFGLINMNGRLYDPYLQRFLSPDPYVQAPGNAQNYNRYSYCLNNPLMFTDPSGEWIHLVIGGIIGAIQGYQIGNAAGLTGWKLFFATVAGAGVGALTANLANAVATSGMVMANTTAILSGSFVNSVGMSLISGASGLGMMPTTLSVGVASLSLSSQGFSFGYLGKDGNSRLENFGYALGAMANLSDLLMGFQQNNIGDVDLITEHSDWHGHSAMVKEGTITNNLDDPNRLISVGPQFGQHGNPHWDAGINHWDTYANGLPDHPIWRETIKVNKTRIGNYAKHLNKRAYVGKLHFSVEISSCVTQTSRALNASGVFNIGIHPYLLHSQMYLRNLGLRPGLFSYYAQ